MSAMQSVRDKGTADKSRQEAKAQLAQHVAQQPAYKQAFHRWIRVPEVAGLAIVSGMLALAIYLSIHHASVPGTTIAAAWFAFPVSAVPLMLALGVHEIVLRASPAVVLPGKRQRLVTGTKAVWSGVGTIVTALLAGAFWVGLAWAAWSFDVALIGSYARVLGTAMGVVIPVAIVLGFISTLYRQFVRPR